MKTTHLQIMDIYKELNDIFILQNKNDRTDLMNNLPVLIIFIENDIHLYRYGKYDKKFTLNLEHYRKIKSVCHYGMRPRTPNNIQDDKIANQIEKDKDIFNFDGISYWKNLVVGELEKDIIHLAMKHCSVLFQDELHNVVQSIKTFINNEEEWNKIFVIVTGPHSPRVGHCAMQYFERLVGSTTEIPFVTNVEPKEHKKNRCLYYVENEYNIEKAIDIAMQLRLERKIFDSIIDMNTDILAFDTREYLKKVCNN